MSKTLTDIDRIVRLTDPVVRNLWITQSYHDLSRGLSTVIDPKNANWSTFALWASKTAGESIRNEEVPKFIVDLLAVEEAVSGSIGRFIRNLVSPVTVSTSDVLDTVREALRDVSLQVADGNLKVYRELAPTFAHYIDEVESVPGVDLALLEGFVSRLVPGPPEQGGQELLREAFRHYYHARGTADPRLRAQLILLGNCKIGLHEQTRLQPNIQAALDAPVADLVTTRLTQRFSGVAKTLGLSLKELAERVTDAWTALATRYAMNLSLPNGTEIALGRDVPSGAREFPVDLHPLSDPDLIAFAGRFDHDLNTLRGSAANDWSMLQDRMRFIVDLFRSRQQDLALFGQPFTDAQRSELQSGRLPIGRL